MLRGLVAPAFAAEMLGSLADAGDFGGHPALHGVEPFRSFMFSRRMEGYIRLSLFSTAQPLYTRFRYHIQYLFSKVTIGYYPRRMSSNAAKLGLGRIVARFVPPLIHVLPSRVHLHIRYLYF